MECPTGCMLHFISGIRLFQEALHMRVLSMMSGTSTDGISWVIADLEENERGINFHIIESGVHEFMPHVRDELLMLTNSGRGSLESVNSAHWNLGQELIRAADKMKNRPEVAVFSGHTLYHAEQSGGVHGGTFQIGAVEPLSVHLNIPVISDFRSGDVAAGGMGAPLVPLADSILFGPGLLVLNIGGISNVSFTGEHITGFDLGPGNMLLDGAMRILFKREYDQDGTIALSGKVIRGLLDVLMKDEFVNADPPKSCGRERFGSRYLEEILENPSFSKYPPEDIITTLAEFTVRSIEHNVRKHFPAGLRLVCAGGGVKNGYFTKRLSELFPGKFQVSDSMGVPHEFREALAFAVIGYLSSRLKTSNSGASGAKKLIPLGKITFNGLKDLQF